MSELPPKKNRPDNPFLNIEFVKSVEKHDIIWNTSVHGYARKENTEKAWNEIAQEYDEPVSVSRERWRNIRTAFFKSERMLAKSKARHPYYLSKYLQFLSKMKKEHEKYKNEAIANENIINNDVNNDSNQNISDSPAEFAIKEEMINDYNNDSDVITDNQIYTNDESLREKSLSNSNGNNNLMKRKLDPVSTETDLNFSDWILPKKSNISEEDADLNFLKSLLPDIKKLTDRQNRSFRLKTLGILDDLLKDVET